MSRKSRTDDYFIPEVQTTLSDASVRRVAGRLRSDAGTPEEALGLIEQFVLEAYETSGPSQNLLVFVRDSLAEYLAGGRSLEAAFRLKRGRANRPSSDHSRHRQAAADILIERVMHGATFEDAVAIVSEKRHMSTRVVSNASKKYRAAALAQLQEQQPPTFDLNDPAQRTQLERIFGANAFPPACK